MAKYNLKCVGRVERSETRQYQGFKVSLADFTGKSKQVLKIVFRFQHVGFRFALPDLHLTMKSN